MEMLSYQIPFGKYPLEPYRRLAFQYLCNLYPKIPDPLINQFLNNYSCLLIPTIKCFRKFLKENADGSMVLQGNRIETLNPPRPLFNINQSEDQAFVQDVSILGDRAKIEKYVKMYSSDIMNSLKDLIMCACCGFEKPSVTSISCSNNHVICQGCFKKMVVRTVRANGKKLLCSYSGGGCTGSFDPPDTQDRLEPQQWQRLVDMGIIHVPRPPSPPTPPLPPPPPPPPSSLQVHHPVSSSSLGSTSVVLPPLPEPKRPLPPLPPPKPKRAPSPIKEYLRTMTAQEEDAEGYVCPITREIMKDPVFCGDGHVYERAAIKAFLDLCGMSPITFEDVDVATFIYESETALKNKIAEYLIYHPDRDPDSSSS